MPHPAHKTRANTLEKILNTLNATYTEHPMAEVTAGDAYKVLIGCIISLRTNDDVTIPACKKLFPLADTPEKMLRLPVEVIEQAIYPAGFYLTKARTIQSISQALLEHFEGRVPNTIDALLTLKGVGRKTANLVMGLGHGLPAICVDVHVHRICNRLGVIATQTPDETEFALRAMLPESYWFIINRVLVMHGRALCKAMSPKCQQCPVLSHCQQVGIHTQNRPVKTAKRTKKAPLSDNQTGS
ncbi:MAG: endonuclease III [Vampirovibrionales bacterium]|nr:endonuclease III [Vampirovibrionales bacterium]